LFNQSISDVWNGLRTADYWRTMAWNDIRSRYRRSRIGQFWITLSVALFVAGIGVVYSGIFNIPIAEYIPRVTASYVFWTFISAVLIGGCTTFIAAAPTMQQRVFPVSTHAFRLVAREVIILAHNALVIVGVWLIFRIGLEPVSLLLIPGLLLNFYIAFWLSILLGLISVRFRDIPPIMQSLVNILFFITPVLWTSERLGGISDVVLAFNPFAYMLEIMREPLLNTAPPTLAWVVVGSIAVVLTIVGLFSMAATRRHLAYWL
jgi:lipopolysaccharide transport system permease protein